MSAFTMIVRETFRVGRGKTVVTGHVQSGVVHTGDSVEMVIGGVSTRTIVRGIEVAGQNVSEASLGEVALMVGCSFVAVT